MPAARRPCTRDTTTRRPFLFATQQAHDESQDSEDIGSMDLSDTDEAEADPDDMGELQEDTQSVDMLDAEVETYTELHTAAGGCRTHVREQPWVL